MTSLFVDLEIAVTLLAWTGAKFDTPTEEAWMNGVARQEPSIPREVSMDNPFSACLCDVTHLRGLPRSPWTHMLPWLCLYRCENCGKTQLHPSHAVDEALQKRATRAAMAKRGYRFRPPRIQSTEVSEHRPTL
ncbi:hypothetical protein [Variovorax boronicumulans]|uniref:hypothetical protein n=1 Tax=Variovorax boronicumulans TaxID=436515 RepID=UPI002787E8B9|nr:hypothetical protein [Variovorax boronicumulans]MDQ0045695.1 hypothetical protein [Variovorax boronicumulans]